MDATHGDNGNDGSSARPWQTLDYAIQTVPAGSTIRLRGQVPTPASISRAFNSTAPLTIEADEARTVAALDLRWPRPNMTGATTLDVPATGGAGTGPYYFWTQNYGGGCPAWTLALANNRDWILRLPGTPGHPDQANRRRSESLNIEGGRNVMIVGGEVTVGPGSLMGRAGEPQRRCIGIMDYTSGSGGNDAWGNAPVPGRIVHIEGVEVNNDGGGSGDGFTVDAPAADLRIQNCRIVRIHSTQGVYTTLTSAVSLPITAPVQVTVANGSGFLSGASTITTSGGVDLRYSGRSGNTFTVTSNFGGSGTLPVGTTVSQEASPSGQAATHADYIQPYGGVYALRMYRVTCSSNLQGLQVRSEPGYQNGPAEFHSMDLSPFFNTNWNPAEPKYQIVMGPNDVNSFDNVYLNPWPGESSIAARVAPDNNGTNNDWPDFAGTAPAPGQPGYGYVNAEDGSGNLTFPGTHAGGANQPNITGTVLKGRPPAGDFMPAGQAGASYDPNVSYTTAAGSLLGTLRFDSAAYIRVSGLSLNANLQGNAAAFWGACSWIELERVWAFFSTGAGVYADGTTNNIGLYGCSVRVVGSHGAYLGGPRSQVVNCLVSLTGLSGGAGVVLGPLADNSVVAASTVDAAGGEGIRIEGDQTRAPTGVIVANVIVSNNLSAGVGSVTALGGPDPGGTVDGVVGWLNGGGTVRLPSTFTVRNLLPGNPGYTNRVAGDYTLSKLPMVVAQAATAGGTRETLGVPTVG